MTETTLLLDLPDELLIRCLAGAGGLSIGSAAASCSRLNGLARRLRQLPVFSSAMSTASSLQHAIREATHRALTGCYGAVDFALLFVANYGNARGKKYSDPTDLGHAVDMLRDVLGQDVVIVGCACAGLMGVGPDSVPIEVDPLANMSAGRAAAAARKKAGLPALPTKGVSVLMGKLPVGCVARGFVQENMEGPPTPADPDSPPAEWSWPYLDECLALTSSQKAALTQQLHALAPSAQAAHPGVASNSHLGDKDASANTEATPSSSVQPAQAAAELGASPETATAAEGLLSVVAAATAAANAGPANASGADDVRLVPQLCLLLYDNALQSFGYTESPEMERALAYLAAKGVPVLGGASSGAADLFYSPGADGRRIMGEPPATPQIVGLMLCTATAPAAAAPADPAQASSAAAAPAGSDDVTDGVKHAHNSAAATEAAAAGSKHGQDQFAASAPSAQVQVVNSHAALHTAGFAALGLGPSDQAPLFTRLHAKIASSQALSVNHIAVQLDVDCCDMIAPAAPAQQAPTSAQQERAGTSGAASDASSTPAAETSAFSDAPAATEAAPEPAGGSTAGLVRRSARLAATAADSKAGPVALTPLHHLYAAVTAAAPVAAFDELDEEDQGQYLALWLCNQGATAAPFTGDEGQIAICELLACELETKPGPALGGSSSVDYVEITAAVHVSSYAALKELINKATPGSSLCCQVVGTKAAACARTVSRCLSQMLPMIRYSTAATASAAGQAGAVSSAGAGRAMQDCYDALARGAVASGARSGLQGIFVASCTGRGQSLYAESDDAAAFGQVNEAQIIDSVAQGGVPFVGVYVSGELGPEVQHMCAGWCKPDGSGGVSVAEMQGFTSMFAGWGCQPGVA